ncbi:hypothetical protein CTAYLR_002109 [Chrysophaeum taylorii]|uniref:Uncharacterized protein n=1 Tax=Chrysophaeum taylorii TaxID=2483200 RepID=A0AAD7UNW6_9STRA|nr:hypothetical protein CTAYLR_002109 [Chrysophaeum taylorii]
MKGRVQRNPCEGFRVIEFVKGECVGRSIRRMVENYDGLSEEYSQTVRKQTRMLQFRPRGEMTEAEENFVLQSQHTCDPSTNLKKRPPPPPELEALREMVVGTAPWLSHYFCGWIQLNHNSNRDELMPHVDKRGWGDVIVTFTLDPISVILEASGSCHRFEIPAYHAYLLSGHARYLAKHKAVLPEGRIGVVMRFYLRDLCKLGARVVPGDYATRLRGRVGEVVCCRWPKADGAPDGVYCSAYPAILCDVVDSVCTVAFFACDDDEDDNNDRLVRVMASLVLSKQESSLWFFEPRCPLARFFRCRPPYEGIIAHPPKRENIPSLEEEEEEEEEEEGAPRSCCCRRNDPSRVLTFDFSKPPPNLPAAKNSPPQKEIDLTSMAAFLLAIGETRHRPPDRVFSEPRATDFFGRHRRASDLVNFAKDNFSKILEKIKTQKQDLVAFAQTVASPPPKRRRTTTSRLGLKMVYWNPPTPHSPGLWIPARVTKQFGTAYILLSGYGLDDDTPVVTIDVPIPGFLSRAAAYPKDLIAYIPINDKTYDALKPRFNKVWHDIYMQNRALP